MLALLGVGFQGRDRSSSRTEKRNERPEREIENIYVWRSISLAENKHGSTKGFEMSAFICARAVSGTASQKQLLTPKEQQVF